MLFFRFCVLRQPRECAVSHQRNERAPNRQQAVEGPTEETEGLWETILVAGTSDISLAILYGLGTEL